MKRNHNFENNEGASPAEDNDFFKLLMIQQKKSYEELKSAGVDVNEEYQMNQAKANETSPQG